MGKEVRVLDTGCNSIQLVPYLMAALSEDAKEKTAVLCTTNNWPGGLSALLLGVYANASTLREYELELKLGKCGPLFKPGSHYGSTNLVSLRGSPGRLDCSSQAAATGEPAEGDL